MDPMSTVRAQVADSWVRSAAAGVEADRVEVVLVMSGRRFDEVGGRLNEVVADLDLECHVRRG